LPTAITQSPTRTSAIVAELDRGQRLVAFDLEQRHIRGLVGADQLGFELAPVGKLDGDLLAVLDDVVVGDDEARLVDDEAGTHRDGFARRGELTAAAAAELIEEIAERLGQIVGVDALLGRDLLFHRDGHDGRAHALHEIREAERRAVLQHARGGMRRRRGRCMHGRIRDRNQNRRLGRMHLGRGAEADDQDRGGGTGRKETGAVVEPGLLF
jgi:hypothetical protein